MCDKRATDGLAATPRHSLAGRAEPAILATNMLLLLGDPGAAVDEYERFLMAAVDSPTFLDERAKEAVERRLAEARAALYAKQATQATQGNSGVAHDAATVDKWYTFSWVGKIFDETLEETNVNVCCTARPKKSAKRPPVRFSYVGEAEVRASVTTTQL